MPSLRVAVCWVQVLGCCAASTPELPSHVASVYKQLNSRCSAAHLASTSKAQDTRHLTAQQPYVSFGISANPMQVKTYIEVARAVASQFGHAQVCEVGFNCGHSAVAFLEADPRVSVRSFDMPGYSWANAGRSFLRERYGQRFHIHDGRSDVILPEFIRNHPDAPKCDLLVVDGSHKYADVMSDLSHMFRMAHCKSSVLLDDVCDPEKCHAHVAASMDAKHAGQNHPTVVGPTRAWAEAKAHGYVLESQAWFADAPDRGWVLAKVQCEPTTGKPKRLVDYPKISKVSLEYSPSIPFTGSWGGSARLAARRGGSGASLRPNRTNEKHNSQQGLSTNTGSSVQPDLDAGVIFVQLQDSFDHGTHSRSGGELQVAVGLLRLVMNPIYPVALFTNMKENDLAEDVDMVLPLQMDSRLVPVLNAYLAGVTAQKVTSGATAWIHVCLYKLSALLLTPFKRTLYLDNDVFVLRPNLIHDILNSTLSLSDLAMPVNPIREGLWENVPAPNLCSCVIAYHSTGVIHRLWLGAASRLATGRVPAAAAQREQEAIWYEWTEALPMLRVMVLPEEYYCPNVVPTRKTTVMGRDGMPTSVGTASWPTNFRVGVLRKNSTVAAGYRHVELKCKALHGHKVTKLVQSWAPNRIRYRRTRTVG